MKSHPHGHYQNETSERALEGQPNHFMRCKDFSPDHPREEELEHLQPYNHLPQPVLHSSQRRGTLREPAPNLREVREVTYTMANLGQLRICPAKAKLASVGPIPTDPDEERGCSKT